MTTDSKENAAIILVCLSPLVPLSAGGLLIRFDAEYAALFAAQCSLWMLMGINSAYYLFVLRYRLDVSIRNWQLIALLPLVLAVVLLCGWESALTGLLALTATTAFAATWTLTKLRILKPRGLWRGLIVIVGALLPLSSVSVLLLGVAVVLNWEEMAYGALASGIPIWLTALFISFKARRAARVLLDAR